AILRQTRQRAATVVDTQPFSSASPRGARRPRALCRTASRSPILRRGPGKVKGWPQIGIRRVPGSRRRPVPAQDRSLLRLGVAGPTLATGHPVPNVAETRRRHHASAPLFSVPEIQSPGALPRVLALGKDLRLLDLLGSRRGQELHEEYPARRLEVGQAL